MKKAVIAIVIIAVIIVFIVQIFAMNAHVKVALVGDILLDRGVREVMQKKKTAYPYDKTASYIKEADIAVGNLESPIIERGDAVLKRGDLIFRGDPKNVGALKEAGFTLLSLANNHAMDYGPKGITDTMQLLKEKGVMAVGAGATQEEARKPQFVKMNGMTVGFMAASAFPPEGYYYFTDRPDVCHLDEEEMKRSIKQAKEKCDLLIVMAHWGKEFDFYPGEHQRLVAHIACDSGADIVIGHHPHVLQGVEEYKGKYIFYSLGNFVFDRQIPEGTDQTALLQISASKNKIKEIVLMPLRIIDCQPTPCSKEEASSIIERIKLYSRDMGTVIEESDGKAYIK